MPEAAVNASLGCGVPTAVADLHKGETVLDLGSGAGADVLISAQRVGPTGRAIGLDMTDEMLDLARANAPTPDRERRVHQGLSRGHAVPDESVDVVISNCVINLSADKPKPSQKPLVSSGPGGLIRHLGRDRRPGMDEATKTDMGNGPAASLAPSPRRSSDPR